MYLLWCFKGGGLLVLQSKENKKGKHSLLIRMVLSKVYCVLMKVEWANADKSWCALCNNIQPSTPTTRTAIVLERYACNDARVLLRRRKSIYRTIQGDLLECCSISDSGPKEMPQNGSKRTKWRLDSHAWVISENEGFSNLNSMLKTMRMKFERNRDKARDLDGGYKHCVQND